MSPAKSNYTWYEGETDESLRLPAWSSSSSEERIFYVLNVVLNSIRLRRSSDDVHTPTETAKIFVEPRWSGSADYRVGGKMISKKDEYGIRQASGSVWLLDHTFSLFAGGVEMMAGP